MEEIWYTNDSFCEPKHIHVHQRLLVQKVVISIDYDSPMGFGLGAVDYAVQSFYSRPIVIVHFKQI
jgi:hypothetical protein